MSKKNNLTHEIKRRLQGRAVMDKQDKRNKSADKKAGEGADREKIYSWATLHSYEKAMITFAKWCIEHHSKEIKKMDDCRQFVNEWLADGIERKLSPYTLWQYKSAAAKFYGCKTTDFIEVPRRKRSEITRSRGKAVRDKGFSEIKNRDLVHFCRHTGLRRHELEKLRGTDLRWIDDKAYIYVKGKGGRERHVPILYQDKAVIERMEKAGDKKVWGRVHSKCDVHGLRREFASEMYRSLARPLGDVPKKERYITRGDMHAIFDKKAMLPVTQALGHSRLSVVAGNYLES